LPQPALSRLVLIPTNEPLTRSGVARLISDAGKKAGITDVRVSAHTFLHTFARMYLENGGGVYKLSRLMGHSEVQITETYLKDFQSREARRDHEQFSPVTSIREAKKEKKKRSGSLFG
jgi:site-specific recombinase XerD